MFSDYINNSLPIAEMVMNSTGPLDYPITESELEHSTKELKKNKAAGPDHLCNEILKCKSTYLNIALLHV